MENSNISRNRHGEHLGVNKIGKNIKKSPLHQPNFATAKQQPQPQVYNINKNDFRSIVQQLTGSPSQDPLPRPPHNSPKPPSMRLQKIRPPPLTPISRPPVPPSASAPYNGNFVRPGPIGLPSAPPVRSPGNQFWANTAESPISAYMRYLQNSIIDSSPRQTQFQPQLQAPPAQVQAQAQAQAQAQVHAQAHQSHPHFQGQVPFQTSSSGLLPTPGAPAFPYPGGAAAFPSPRGNAAALLPSPTSQFLLPSPSFFSNLLSPRSPYPLISPSFQYPPPLTPNFAYSPRSQSGILGPGPQPPPSPGILFPYSPSGLFPLTSPRWRDQ